MIYIPESLQERLIKATLQKKDQDGSTHYSLDSRNYCIYFVFFILQIKLKVTSCPMLRTAEGFYDLPVFPPALG